MAHKNELMLFVVRAPGRSFRLVTEEGSTVVEAGNWRELKRNLDVLLRRDTSSAVKVTICVGQPRPVCPVPPPSRPRLAPVLHPTL